MQLPSETHTGWENLVIAILGTLGAGGALKFYTQWQAGRASIRAETTTRIRMLEDTVAALQKELGDLREKNGEYRARVELLTAQLNILQNKST